MVVRKEQRMLPAGCGPFPHDALPCACAKTAGSGGLTASDSLPAFANTGPTFLADAKDDLRDSGTPPRPAKA